MWYRGPKCRVIGPAGDLKMILLPKLVGSYNGFRIVSALNKIITNSIPPSHLLFRAIMDTSRLPHGAMTSWAAKILSKGSDAAPLIESLVLQFGSCLLFSKPCIGPLVAELEVSTRNRLFAWNSCSLTLPRKNPKLVLPNW